MSHQLWDIIADLKSPKYRWVELSHEVSPKTPHWEGFPTLTASDWFTHGKENVCSVVHSIVTQYGTHVDAPYHFIADGRKLHEIELSEMVLPLCVIDVSEPVAKNPDFGLTADHIQAWESIHGRIPDGAFVAMRTDWYKRPGGDTANKDANGEPHYPGWSSCALKFLVEERNITAIGHEPSDTDPSYTLKTAMWEGERYILGQNRYQIELMRNLDVLPPTGAVIFCCFPRVKDSPGFTARCFAVMPR